jgi:hypothetical protein
MRLLRRLLPLLVAVLWLVPAGTALAQELPKLPTTAPPKGGYCAPWHRCVAYGALALAAGVTLLFGVGYLVQGRGFDTLEHKQGNPEGVPAKKG